MRHSISSVTISLLFVALTGCGGGGGVPGGGFAAGGQPQEPAAKLSATVTVNDAAAVPDREGAYPVKPGDRVTVTPSAASTWSTETTQGGLVELRGAAAMELKWTAQLLNAKAQPTTYTVTSKSKESGATARVVLKVGASHVQNGEYQVFATNGTQHKLRLNLDAKTFELSSVTGTVTQGSFSASPSEPGTYVFATNRVRVAEANARFRLTEDALVGAFPLELAQSGPFAAYSVQPFVAVRQLLSEQAALQGIYNRLGIDITPSSRDSNIRQVEVLPGGAAALMCDDTEVRSIEACPPAAVVTYAVTPGTPATRWQMTNVSDPGDVSAFSIARVGGQNVYLAAGLSSQQESVSIFRIGLEDTSAWPSAVARGADTAAGWGQFAFDATTYTSTLTKFDGTASALAYAASDAGVAGPRGMRVLNQGPSALWAVQNGKLAAVAGGRGTSEGGFLQLGLVD
jgi:hypothetical protein